MSESNKSYRIRTVVGQDTNLTVNLDQDYDVFEVLSIKLKQEDTYKLHSSNYGVIVGRVLANEGFGVPNAKISVFIQVQTQKLQQYIHIKQLHHKVWMAFSTTYYQIIKLMIAIK